MAFFFEMLPLTYNVISAVWRHLEYVSECWLLICWSAPCCLGKVLPPALAYLGCDVHLYEAVLDMNLW